LIKGSHGYDWTNSASAANADHRGVLLTTQGVGNLADSSSATDTSIYQRVLDYFGVSENG
jgi:queuine/archaeosine tRNA-ribosyltransferase